ncbi:MAG TPA: AMP-binding protein, partial [Afipia sp.]
MASSGSDGPDTHGVSFLTPSVTAEPHADGTIVLRSDTALRPYARCVGDWLEHWAQEAPERTFLAERSSPDLPWVTLSYAETLRRVRGAGSWILAQEMSAQRPLAVLSDNGIEHAVLALAAMHVGVPVAAISPAYSLMSQDFEKLRGAIQLLDPGAIYVSDLQRFGPALAAIAPFHTATVIGGGATAGAGWSYGDVVATPVSAAIYRAFEEINA